MFKYNEMEKEESKRITTSIKINQDVWKKFKIHCIEKNKEISDCIEELIKGETKN